MKITELDLHAPIEIGDGRTRITIHRDLMGSENLIAELSIRGGPLRMRLTMSMDELKGLAWDALNAGLGQGDDAAFGREAGRKLILEGFTAED